MKITFQPKGALTCFEPPSPQATMKTGESTPNNNNDKGGLSYIHWGWKNPLDLHGIRLGDGRQPQHLPNYVGSPNWLLLYARSIDHSKTLQSNP